MIIHINSMQHKTFLSLFNHPISSRSRFFSTGKHIYSHGTYLTVPSYIRILKCSMHLAKHVVKNHVIPRSKSALGTLPSKGSSRGMASVHGGQYNFPADPVVASNDAMPVQQGDHSGYHQVVAVAVCSKKGCKDQNCATETNLSTGDNQPNPCGESVQYHQKPIEEHLTIVHELAGILTHKTPPTMSGIIVDSQKDTSNKNKPQELGMDPGTTPIDPTEFRENSGTSIYLQDDGRTQIIIKAMSSDSVLNQNP
jgi:hypothetical protein